jgi:hypothetical protein
VDVNDVPTILLPDLMGAQIRIIGQFDATDELLASVSRWNSSRMTFILDVLSDRTGSVLGGKQEGCQASIRFGDQPKPFAP